MHFRIKDKKKYSFVLVLLFSIVLLYGIYKNFIFLILAVIPIVYIWINKVKVKKWIIYLLIGSVPILIYFLIRDFKIFEHIPNSFIINGLLSFIKKSYSDATSAIIALICFGWKTNSESWIIYNQTKHLSIIYLMSIGGFQVSFLKLIISKLIKNRKAALIVNLIVIGFYSYLLSFRSGILRVLLCLIISSTCKKLIKNKYDILSLSAILTIFIEPTCVFDFGFCLSYLCTFCVMWIYDMKFDNVLFEMLMINVTCVLISIPFVSKMEGCISLGTILFTIGFNYMFIAAYIWYISTFYLVFLYPVHDFIANSLFWIVNGIYSINIELKIKRMNDLLDTLFFIVCYLGYVAIWRYRTKNDLMSIYNK